MEGAFKRRSGKAALMRTARELCEREGGRLIVIDEGKVVSACEWRDAGAEDPEASGHWQRVHLNPRDFKDAA